MVYEVTRQDQNNYVRQEIALGCVLNTSIDSWLIDWWLTQQFRSGEVKQTSPMSWVKLHQRGEANFTNKVKQTSPTRWSKLHQEKQTASTILTHVRRDIPFPPFFACVALLVSPPRRTLGIEQYVDEAAFQSNPNTEDSRFNPLHDSFGVGTICRGLKVNRHAYICTDIL